MSSNKRSDNAAAVVEAKLKQRRERDAREREEASKIFARGFADSDKSRYYLPVNKEELFEEFEGLEDSKKFLVVSYMRALAVTELPPADDNKVRSGPGVAPLLYAERPDRTEKAPDFIRRVYAPWLDGDFTRADLRQLDPKCAAALNNFESNRGEGRIPLTELNLPTVQERNDRLLSEGLDGLDRSERRRLQHVISKRDGPTSDM